MSLKLFLMRCIPGMLFGLTLIAAPTALAATSPSLGAASSYSVLSGAGATNGGAGVTTISGDLGVSPASTYTDLGSTTFLTAGNPHLADSSAAAAQVAQKAVFDGPLDFVQQPCTVTYVATTELSSVGPLDPGVYCTDATHDFTLSGTLTLHGTGSPATDVWIFRSSRDVIGSGTANIIFTGTGGLACNVWWRVANTATFTANNAMVGNILAATSITFGQSATLNGRAFAYTGAVTLLGNTISGPTCSTPVASSGSSATPAPMIHVTKVPSPLALPAGPGPVTYSYVVTNPGPVQLNTVTLTDDKCSNVTYVSGDTNGDTWLQSNEVWNYTCTTSLSQTTINFATARGLGNGMAAVDTAIAYVVVGVPIVPPLIDIVKTPSPFTLPFQGGSVTYRYVVTNPGTVGLTGVTVTDNTCSSVARVSGGDPNGNGQLDPGETWTYTCSATLAETTTNTAVATGHANGLTAVDTALATVTVLGSPLPPPLIHIIKEPIPLILPAGGGVVAYTYTVTNPGGVPLNTVTVADDKCDAMTFVSGDGNGDGLMETYETWTYRCEQHLTNATLNTATATGHANGLTVTDVAVANVVLAPALVPAPTKLPHTGFDPADGPVIWMISGGVLAVAALFFVIGRRKRSSNEDV